MTSIPTKHKTQGYFTGHPTWTRLLFLVFVFVTNGSLAQKFEIVLGSSKIGANEVYTITLTARDASLDDYSNFPNITGFSKAGTSSSTSMSSVNGRVSNETSIIQNYMPEKQGTFKLPPFTMKVNGVTVRSPGATIEVGPPVEQKRADPFGADPFAYDPFEDFFNKPVGAEAKADAFFSVQTDKKEIWVGEGVNITVSFLVADDNMADMNFYDLGNQLQGLLKKIKPENCWEENFGIDEIVPFRTRIGKKNYTEYRIYQSTLYPLTPKPISIPALTLNMARVRPGAGFYGAVSKDDIKPFASRPVLVKVKDLPPHPLKGKVSVGEFTLQEKLASKEVGINQGLAVDLAMVGEGNISYIPEPSVNKTSILDIYPPNTSQNIRREAGKVRGQKVFSYLLVPREQGSFKLRDNLYWVYFNTKTARYDTLFPKGVFQVSKSQKKGAGVSAKTQDSFYSWIDKADPTEIDLNKKERKGLFWINIAMATMAGITLLLSLLRRKS
jgi:hypothetical protein